MKALIVIVGAAVIAWAAWWLVTNLGLGRFPQPAATASAAERVGSYMVQFGLVIIAVSAAVALIAQVVATAIMKADGPPSIMVDLGEFMKNLGELIKTPAGMGFGVVLLGVVLMFPTAFAAP